MHNRPTKLASFILITITAVMVLMGSRSWAQTTATWFGVAGTDWNTAANWDLGTVPGPGTNAAIAAGYVVDYNAPMAASSLGAVTVGGTLNLAAGGFVVDTGGTNEWIPVPVVPLSLASLSVLHLQNGGVLVVTNSGAVTMAVDSIINIDTGGTLMTTNTLAGESLVVGPNGRNNGAAVTLSNGTMILDKKLSLRGGQNAGNIPASTVTMNDGLLVALGGTEIRNSQDDARTSLTINGGAAYVGDFLVERSSINGGLVLSNGAVTATSLRIGTGIAAAFSTVYGGILTNTGPFAIADRTNAANSGTRRVYLNVRGGQVYSTSIEGVVINNQAEGDNSNLSNIGGTLDITGGTLTSEKITLNGPNVLSNAYARLQFGGSGAIYLGAGGLVANTTGDNLTAVITLAGGTLGAKDDWSSSANMTLNGGVTFKAADALDQAHNLSLAGILSGSGSLIKSGTGVLTLNAAQSYSGDSIIQEGTLAIGPGGSVVSGLIHLYPGATFDVSAAGYSLAANQALVGSGNVTGTLSVGGGARLVPGGTDAAGTLRFAAGLSLTGEALIQVDLSDDPSGLNQANDLVEVTGNLTVQGLNNILVSALDGFLPESVYPLIRYTGQLNGGLTNFAVSGGLGVLTNPPGMIALIPALPRPASDLTWKGDNTTNRWDTGKTANWLNHGTNEVFFPGDTVWFDDSGSTNPAVELAGYLTPAALVVNASQDYQFSGAGTIAGNVGLLKTNSGTLTIWGSNHGYTGATIITGGTLAVSKLDNGGAPSSIGRSTSDPANLVLNGGALIHLGDPASSDRSLTLGADGGTLGVASNISTLTLSGTLIGDGDLTIAGAGTVNLTSANSYAGATTISNGVLRLTQTLGASTNPVTVAGGTLFLAGSADASFLNNFVVANSGGLVSGPNNNRLNGSWFGSGTLDVRTLSGTVFTVNGDLTPFVGTIRFSDDSTGTFRFNSGGGNTTYGTTNALFELGHSTVSLQNRNGSATIPFDLGGLSGGPGTRVLGAGSANNPTTYSIGGNQASTTFAGSIQDANASRIVHLLKVGAGKLTLSGSNTYTGSTVITNGVLALSGDGTIANTTPIELMTNTVLEVTDRIDGTLTLHTGQTLKGEGTVRGSLTVGDGSTLSPGPADNIPSRLVITNALVLQAGSTITMDLDHYQLYGSHTNDVIDGLESVTYGGTLNLILLSVAEDSVFKLFHAGSYHGAFAAINPPAPMGVTGKMWDTSRLTVDGTLRIAPFQARIQSVRVEGANFIMTGLMGASFAYQTYYVLISTNIALPLSQWSVSTPQFFDLDGAYAFTNAIRPEWPQQYHLLQMTAP